ncbi:membrane-spanning 4-domains subfamily A member 4A-like [Ctenopharyngodon idella]|uniref:membrane-spanning 4-domains subfamily A member 4A-like n=1 Tax=Ctenopharyngodon idella TaxID=7959 RepID=UPI002230A5BA|nr:membrane-spanning 4-domains subfamily A member 4A-like [Ctenopharyngodon idella]
MQLSLQALQHRSIITSSIWCHHNSTPISSASPVPHKPDNVSIASSAKQKNLAPIVTTVAAASTSQLAVISKTLPRMETSRVISTDKATVVIQINPQAAQNAVICDDGQEARGAHHNMALKGFFKAQPKALGTVQIMIGVVIFLFGIVRTSNINNNYLYPAISVISGITYWGSFIYISAGSLSVAAQNKLDLCVVKASLIMNVIGAITAGIAILLMGIEIGLLAEIRCYNDYGRTTDTCSHFKRYDLGINGILLVFSILQFIISICISGFACKATTSNNSTVVSVALNQIVEVGDM